VGTFFNTPVGPIAGATAAQPYSNHKLPPSLETVPNPPFVRKGGTPQLVAEYASIAQPNPWVYAFESRVGRPGPYQGQTLPPALLTVPNPPFSNRSRTQQIIALNASAAQPSPWPYVYLDNTTGAQPYGPPTPVPPPSPVVLTQTPYANQWMASVIQSWQPTWAYVYLDPTEGAQPYGPPTPQPQQNVIPSTLVPYNIAWMSGVIRAWFPEPPAPIIPVKSNVDDLVVGNPPVVGNSNYWLLPVVQSWITPPPAPVLPTYSNPGNLVVPNPPIIGAYRWQPPYPDTYVPPQPIHFQPPPTAAVVVTQSPYSNAWLATVILSWFGDAPRPQQPRPGNPSYFANNPPPLVPVPVWANTAGIYQHTYTLLFPQLGSNNLGGVQPPAPPIPPPPSTGELTVSGPDVTTYLQEVFYDVVYELAEVEKETV
jgi:hypothetical protein